MAKCTPCMGADIKDAILAAIDNRAVRKVLSALADCPEPEGLSLCAGKKGGGKREPSAYNLHIRECMGRQDLKGKPFGSTGPIMAKCAAEWKEKKGK